MFPPSIPSRDIQRLVEWDYYPEIRNAERRQTTTSAIERREPRPDPLGKVLAKLLNGGVLAAVAAWPARLIRARRQVSARQDGARAQEYDLAAMRLQTSRVAEQPPITAAMVGERIVRLPIASDRYPILSAIDRAREDGRPALAEDPDAARLEHLARRLTEQFWSERAWVTGFVPERAFGFVCDVLERERTAAVRLAAAPADLSTAA